MVVADTNLVIALVVAHPLHAQSAALFVKDQDWHLPDWWQIELANALRNYHRAGQLDPGSALLALERALSIIPSGNTHSVDLSQTLGIACALDISAYDARFIALARFFGQKLVTEDIRLRSACPQDTSSIAETLALP